MAPERIDLNLERPNTARQRQYPISSKFIASQTKKHISNKKKTFPKNKYFQRNFFFQKNKHFQQKKTFPFFSIKTRNVFCHFQCVGEKWHKFFLNKKVSFWLVYRQQPYSQPTALPLNLSFCVDFHFLKYAWTSF